MRRNPPTSSAVSSIIWARTNSCCFPPITRIGSSTTTISFPPVSPTTSPARSWWTIRTASISSGVGRVRFNPPFRGTILLATGNANSELHVIRRDDARFRFPRLAHQPDHRRVSVSRGCQRGDAFGGATLRNAGQQSARRLRIEQQGARRRVEVATDDAAGGEILRQQCRGNSGYREIARALIERDRRKVEFGRGAARLEHLAEMAGEAEAADVRHGSSAVGAEDLRRSARGLAHPGDGLRNRSRPCATAHQGGEQDARTDR